MDDKPEPHRPNWRVPLAVSVGGTAVGGLLLAGILALANVLSDLSGAQIMAFVVLPVLLAGMFAFLTWMVWKMLRVYAEWWKWRNDVDEQAARTWGAILAASYSTRRAHLDDVIDTAMADGWTVVEDDDGDLAFVTPDGQRAEYVSELTPDPRDVAALLHKLDPDSFDGSWTPYVTRLSDDVNEIRASTDVLEIDLSDIRGEAETSTARAVLHVFAAEAAARGWVAHWFGDRVEFINNGAGAIATVRYHDGDIDFVKLRTVLGLDQRPPT